MVNSVRRLAASVLVAVGAVALAGAAPAQNSGIAETLEAATTQGELRARQAALFQQLFEDPDDLDLMFEYAQVSIRIEDYEAAISTLERMLIYRQDLGRVRLELAVAYFNLGSYAVSKLYFEQVLEDPETPQTVRVRIQRYLDAIEQRTSRHNFAATATVGITHATNATLGPDGTQVLFAGNTATLLSGRSEADTGLRVTLDLGHEYDLGQADDDVWRTNFSLFGLQYFDTDEGDLIFGRIRSGPRLSLDEQQFGPKLRPYIEAQYLHSEGRGLFSGFAVGAEVQDTLSNTLSVFGDTGLRYRNYFRQEFTDEDAYTIYGAVGVAYIPVRNLILRSTLLLDIDSADGDQNSNQEVGLRLAGEYSYDPGFAWVDQRWAASGYLEVRGRWFEEPDPVVSPTITRRDVDFRGGLRHIFTLRDGFGIQLDVDGLVRSSNVVNFDLNNLSTTLSLRYRL